MMITPPEHGRRIRRGRLVAVVGAPLSGVIGSLDRVKDCR